MKYLLIMHVNPTVWEALSEDERTRVLEGHVDFIGTIKRTGELISTHALAEPTDSSVVRVRDGAPVVTDGPFVETKEYLGGYYLVECESKERAQKVAAMIPDAGIEGLGIEVRPVVFSEVHTQD